MLSAEEQSARRSSCSKATDLRPVGEVEPEGGGMGVEQGGGAGLRCSLSLSLDSDVANSGCDRCGGEAACVSLEG